jgi:hypothetical protein
MGLQQFERRLERLVEGVFAKAFRSGLQPVEVGRRLTREMDLHRTHGVRGLVAPNAFEIALAPPDHQRFEPFADTLVRDLGEMARQHARDEGYTFLGAVEITLEADPSLTPGMFLVSGEVREGRGGGPVGSLLLPDGNRIALGDDPVTIGRLPDCDVVLEDRNISRRHAEVRRIANGFAVVDLDSTNGTRVNGGGVKERRLEDGDEITLGSSKIRFEAS